LSSDAQQSWPKRILLTKAFAKKLPPHLSIQKGSEKVGTKRETKGPGSRKKKLKKLDRQEDEKEGKTFFGS
jgi:hypothetical protein